MPTAPVKIYEPAPAGLEALVISGVATAGGNGRLVHAGLKGGYSPWSSDGSQVVGAANAIQEYTGTQWKLSLGSAYSALKTSAAASPVGLTSWTVGTGSGSPTVAAATVAEAAEIFVPATSGGEPDAPAEIFVPETGGDVGVNQAITLTVETGSSTNGNVAVTPATFTLLFGVASYAAGLVAILSTDTAAQVAGKIRAGLGATILTGSETWGDNFDITGADDEVILTVKTAAANVPTASVGLTNATTSGVTGSAVVSVAGVAGGSGPDAPVSVLA